MNASAEEKPRYSLESSSLALLQQHHLLRERRLAAVQPVVEPAGAMIDTGGAATADGAASRKLLLVK